MIISQATSYISMRITAINVKSGKAALVFNMIVFRVSPF